MYLVAYTDDQGRVFHDTFTDPIDARRLCVSIEIYENLTALGVQFGTWQDVADFLKTGSGQLPFRAQSEAAKIAGPIPSPEFAVTETGLMASWRDRLTGVGCLKRPEPCHMTSHPAGFLG